MNFYPVQMKFQSEKNVVTKTLENQWKIWKKKYKILIFCTNKKK